MVSQIIKTKLNIPFSRTTLVHKALVLKKLDNSKSLKLTIVSAPPGSGKTTLLAEWAKKSKLPVAWISLDKGDNDPARFCTYLVSSIQTINKQFKGTVLGMLNSLIGCALLSVMRSLKKITVRRYWSRFIRPICLSFPWMSMGNGTGITNCLLSFYGPELKNPIPAG